MSILIGGVYFTDKRIGWEFRHPTIRVPWENVFRRRSITIESDWYFVFGIKKWTRRLKKARVPYGKCAHIIAGYLQQLPKVPMGVLDDCNLDDELAVGDELRRILFERFDCRVYLLREYRRSQQYDQRVIPFSIPCQDYYKQLPKTRMVWFHGNNSHPSRKKWVRKLGGIVYDGGEQSKQKVPFERFVSEIARSRICLCFPGAGNCTFRYQEIPSVGSLMATPEMDWVVRNDYENKKHCIRFRSVNDIKPNEDWAAAGHEHFLKYHTTEVRMREFEEYLGEVRRD